MNATIQNGQVTYVGFNPNDNNKWLIETKMKMEKPIQNIL